MRKKEASLSTDLEYTRDSVRTDDRNNLGIDHSRSAGRSRKSGETHPRTAPQKESSDDDAPRYTRGRNTLFIRRGERRETGEVGGLVRSHVSTIERV